MHFEDQRHAELRQGAQGEHIAAENGVRPQRSCALSHGGLKCHKVKAPWAARAQGVQVEARHPKVSEGQTGVAEPAQQTHRVAVVDKRAAHLERLNGVGRA
jgi:hypothetical protein